MKKNLINFLFFSLILFSCIFLAIPSVLSAQNEPSCNLNFNGYDITMSVFNSYGFNWQFTVIKNGALAASEKGQITNNAQKEGQFFWEKEFGISEIGNYDITLQILDGSGNLVCDKSLNFEILKPEYNLDIYAGFPDEDTVINLSAKNSLGLTWVFSISNKSGEKIELFGKSDQFDSDNWNNSFTVKLKEGTFIANLHIKTRDGRIIYNVDKDFKVENDKEIITLPLKNKIDDKNYKFRPSGLLTPEITTYIPTILDISTKPSVIKTNMLLAILTMLPFAAASELFTRTLSGTEEALKFKILKARSNAFLGRMKRKMEKTVGRKIGRFSIIYSITRLLSVILFYGLAFSLLDRTWKPFSLPGLVLFLNMTIAYGIVGIADDIMQWRVLKRSGVPAEFSVHPSNVLISVFSISVSRLITIVPGMMFGTPEAIRVDESRLDKKMQNLMLKISAITFLTIGFGLWLVTIATRFIQGLEIPAVLSNLVGGFEGFILLVCAVALENTFVQMLGFTNGFGQALKKKNRWLWIIGLMITTFVFYHTLINPRSDLVEALQKNNVILFISVAIVFVIISFGIWFYFRIKNRKL